jgi:hypothetical protein
MALKWDYQKLTCDISMPGYVINILNKLQHDAPKHLQHTPMAPKLSMPPNMRHHSYPQSNAPTSNIQDITGSVLYYAMVVDPTVLMSLNDIATEQTKAT